MRRAGVAKGSRQKRRRGHRYIRPSFRGTRRATLRDAVRLLRGEETLTLARIFRRRRKRGASAKAAMDAAVALTQPGEFYGRLCDWCAPFRRLGLESRP